jgi:hypothetical protein
MTSSDPSAAGLYRAGYDLKAIRPCPHNDARELCPCNYAAASAAGLAKCPEPSR